jgi:protein TonB
MLGSIALHAAALGLTPGQLRRQAPTPEPLQVRLPPAESLPRPLPVSPSAPPSAQPPAVKKHMTQPTERLRVPRLAAQPEQPVFAAPKVATDAAPAEARTLSAAPASPAAAKDALAASKELPPLSAPEFLAAYLHNPKPPYPISARRNGESGTVRLKVLVTSEGAAGKVELERSSGFDALDQAALETVKRWRFVPARRGDEAVDRWVTVPIDFRLGN